MVVRFYKRIVKSIDRASSLNCMLRPIKYQKFKKALVIFPLELRCCEVGDRDIQPVELGSLPAS